MRYKMFYEFPSFAKNMKFQMSKNNVKIFLTVLHMQLKLLKNLQQMEQKLLQKEQFKKQQKQLVISKSILANLNRAGNMTKFFIIEEAKETVLAFSQGTVKVL